MKTQLRQPLIKEQTLGEFIAELWRARIFILVGVGLGFLCAVSILVLSIPHYRATMTLSPANPMGSLSTNHIVQDATGYGSSAYKTRQDDLLFTHFQTMYKGASVAALLLRDEDILEGLERDEAFTFFGLFPDRRTQWNAAKLADYMAQRVSIDPIGETSLRIFSYSHADPVFAALFLKRLHETTDGLIRYGLRKEVSERIHYLHEALGQTQNPQHRRNFTDLLMEQERLKMLVTIDQPYAAFVVEPSSTLARSVWPDPALLFAAFVFCGALIGFSIYSIRNAGKAVGRDSPAQTLSKHKSKTQTRKMRDWVRKDSENNNTHPFSASNAAE